MKGRDLNHEAIAAGAAARQPHIDRLVSLGVTKMALAELGARQVPFGVMSVEPIGSGIFQPGEGAERVISPVIEDGGIIDLIAWHTGNPRQWLWRVGTGWALGADELYPRWDDTPLQLHETPLEWLKGAGHGICILDWSSPDVRRLASVEAIEADQATADRLLSILHRPVRLPRMLIRKAVARAA